MKILSENEQKQAKMNELSRLRGVVFDTVNSTQKLINKEKDKDNRMWTRNTDYRIIQKYETQIDNLLAIANNLTEYRDLIEDSIQEAE